MTPPCVSWKIFGDEAEPNLIGPTTEKARASFFVMKLKECFVGWQFNRHLFLRSSVLIFFIIIIDVQMPNRIAEEENHWIRQMIQKPAAHQVSNWTFNTQRYSTWWQFILTVCYVFFFFFFSGIILTLSGYSYFILLFLLLDWLVVIGVIVAVGAILLVCAAVARRNG